MRLRLLSFPTLAYLHRTMSTSTRTYADAIDSLNSLQSNAAVIEAIRLNGGKDGLVKEVETLEFLRRIGYEVSCLFGGLARERMRC